MTSAEVFLCASLILLSAYLAASEVAIFSLSRFQLRSLKENFRPIHRKIKKLLADPGGLLISLLIVTEVVNIALSTLIASAVARVHLPLPAILSNTPTWLIETFLGIAVTTPIILIFCEITPKVVGTRMNRVVATLTAGPLSLIYEACRPLQFLLKQVIRLFSPAHKPLRKEHAIRTEEDKQEDRILKEADFLLMLEEGHKEGAIQESELELIKNVFALDNTTVADIATPIAQVLAIPSQTTVKGALSMMRSQQFSRIPVYGTNKKDIVGILYAKDLLRTKLQPEGLSTTIATLMRKPFFVTSTLKLGALFRRFKLQKNHMGVVKDPHGEVMGVVTMNDVLDEVFEGLFGEDDLFEAKLNKLSGEKQ